MKLLIITPYIPYPLSEGGKVSQFAVIDYLRKFCDITLILIVRSKVELGYVSELKSLFPEVQIEAIEFLPANTDDSFVKQKLRWLKNKTKYIISKKPNKSNISALPITDFDNGYLVNLVYSKNRKLIEAIARIAQKEKYDAVEIDFIDFIDIVLLFDKNIKKIFVHHELRFGRLDSMIPAEKRGAYERYVFQVIHESEINYLNKYDAIIVFSDHDKIKLEEAPVLNGKVYVSPFPVLDEYFVPYSKMNGKVEKLVFIGGDEHFPNFDAVQWFINEIEPLVSLNTDLKLHVVGKWSKINMDRVNKNKKITFEGFTADLISFCKNSIVLVPVRYGSGIRTKILYAMAQGLPIISTSVGSQGIKAEHGSHLIIADTPEDIADNIIALTNNLELCYNLSVSAQQAARAFYSQEVAGEIRKKLLQSIVNIK